MDFGKFWGGAAAPYEIEQSLRFDGSGPSRLTYDNTSGTNNSSSAWTLSFWMKRGDPISSSPYGNDLHLMMWTPSGSCANTEYFLIADPNHGNTTIQNGMSFNGGGYSGNIANKLRDPSAWYHFVWRGNTGSSTNIVYINGVPVTAYFQGPSSMTSQYVNGASRWSIGDSYTGCSSSPWEGYLAEVHFVDGQTLDHEDFGEFDESGVWRPIRYTGTYGTNGYYLKFDPSATNGVGHDHSGNGHHWTASNVTTSGTGTDVMDDTPTTNWCTLNPLKKGANVTLSDGNLVATMTSTNVRWNGTIAMSPGSGKYYAEMTVTQTNNYGSIGLSSIDDPASGETSGYLGFNGNYKSSAYGSSYGTGDVIGIAYDAVNGAVYFSKNGTWQNSGDPTSGSSATGAAESGLTGTYVFGGGVYGGTTGIYTLNFGQRDFAYTPPTGYSGLNTANLPAPDIADGSKYFDTKLYTANNQTAQTISGLGFSPDLLWFKPRNRSEHHYLYDQVRGAGNRISSSQTIAEVTGDNSLTAFTSDGFSLGADGAGIVNYSTDSMVAWAWDAGGSGSSNTAGSITSTVSANPSAGFSIVSYTGNVTQGATVGHGLGVPLDAMIIKHRNSSYNWAVYHSAMDATAPEDYYISIDGGGRAGPNSNIWQSTPPTSTTFEIGDLGEVNADNQPYIAYCFAEVEGYSKFGRYSGNSSDDGAFVHLGFRPSFLMIVGTNSGSWQMYDTTRMQINPVGNSTSGLQLEANNASNPSGSMEVDLLSNGFKCRTSNSAINFSGRDYIYFAFAESPFGGSGVSPATAR